MSVSCIVVQSMVSNVVVYQLSFVPVYYVVVVFLSYFYFFVFCTSFGVFNCVPFFVLLFFFFFFNQKTPYELRISAWSSYVCSSDLLDRRELPSQRRLLRALDGRKDRPRRFAPPIATRIRSLRRDGRGQRLNNLLPRLGLDLLHRRLSLHIEGIDSAAQDGARVKQGERGALVGLRIQVAFLPRGGVGKTAFPNVFALDL